MPRFHVRKIEGREVKREMVLVTAATNCSDISTRGDKAVIARTPEWKPRGEKKNIYVDP